MSVGLPGSGIGGIFYLVSALYMPFDRAFRAIKGEGEGVVAQQRRQLRVRLVTRQTLLALGIVAALFVTGVALDHLIVALQTHAPSADGLAGGARNAASVPRFFREASFALTFGTLALVLFSVQVMRLVFRRAVPLAAKTEPEKRRAAWE